MCVCVCVREREREREREGAAAGSRFDPILRARTGCGLHCGHESGGMHAQFPPVPSQQRMPKALQVAEHDAEQLHGSSGRGPGVGGGTGGATLALTSG